MLSHGTVGTLFVLHVIISRIVSEYAIDKRSGGASHPSGNLQQGYTHVDYKRHAVTGVQLKHSCCDDGLYGG